MRHGDDSLETADTPERDAGARRFTALPTADVFLAAECKRVIFFGMSGVGKTVLANRLRRSGRWFHYCVDYRIGSHYLRDAIQDACMVEAMKQPFLRPLLMSDSIYIGSNLSIDDLAPLSAWLGTPGDPRRGGLPFDVYLDRQRRHRRAELNAMLDAPAFAARARELYGYPHFLCDASGSLVEIVDPNDPEDHILSRLASTALFVLIEDAPGDAERLRRRFEASPKPIYFEETHLLDCWRRFIAASGAEPEDVDPSAFMRAAFRELVGRRAPKYRKIAERWGVKAPRAALADAEDEAGIMRVLAEALDRAADQTAPAAAPASGDRRASREASRDASWETGGEREDRKP